MKPYRMFPLWIALGIGLPALVLFNSISSYRQISQRVIVGQLRRELAADAAKVDKQLRAGAIEDSIQLAAAMQEVRQAAGTRLAWMQVRDGEGAVVARSGLVMPASFAPEDARAKLRERQPVYKTMSTARGAVVVEAFPVRLPRSELREGETRRQFGVLEVAAFLASGTPSLWPLQRSLILNSVAALALAGLIVLIGVNFRSYVEGRQIERQLEIARRVQRDLLPPEARVSEDFDLAADCLPAARVGGDFYDVIRGPQNSAAFVLGDVSGKGIPAALLMGVMHGAIRSCSWTESARRHEEATAQINRLLCEGASGERYASMFWSYFDPETNLLRYVNAGHFPPLLFRAEAPERPLRLEEGGPVLGLLPNARYEQGAVCLGAGDMLVLYSDGVIEASNSADEQFGEERLLAAIQNSFDRPAEAIRNAVIAAIEKHTGHTAADDDRTLLVIRYTGAAHREEPEMKELAIA